MLEILAIESVANILKVYRNLHETRIQLDVLRPGTRRWGRRVWIHVPDHCHIIQLADHLELSNAVLVSTEPNGQGIPVTLKEGVCFTAAMNQKALDGGAILSEADTEDVVIFTSQSKFEMDYVPQTGREGDSTIAKTEANQIIQAMRKQAGSILARLNLAPGRRVIMVYDVFTTRSIGARLAKEKNPFEPNQDEVIYLTTADCVGTALGPILSVRANMKE